MNNKIALESLASDLKRVALGSQRGASKMVERFIEEALARKQEVDTTSVDSYIVILLDKMEQSLKNSDLSRRAEDALMYSTLFQNFTQKHIQE